MASIGQQRQEAIDKKWEADSEGNLQAKEQSDVPYYIRNPEQDPAQGWQQPAEYESTSPFQKSETHRPMGALITSDYQTNRVGIKGPEGFEIYSVGDYVPGLGYVEDIDENGRATILPDDPNEPAYKLGHSDSTSQEKAAAELQKRMEQVREQMVQHQARAANLDSRLMSGGRSLAEDLQKHRELENALREKYLEEEGREVSPEQSLGGEINPTWDRADIDPTAPIPEGMGRFEPIYSGEMMDWAKRIGVMTPYEPSEPLEVEEEESEWKP